MCGKVETCDGDVVLDDGSGDAASVGDLERFTTVGEEEDMIGLLELGEDKAELCLF